MRGGDLEMLKRAVVLLKRERERERDNFSVNERGLIGPRRESQCYISCKKSSAASYAEHTRR